MNYAKNGIGTSNQNARQMHHIEDFPCEESKSKDCTFGITTKLSRGSGICGKLYLCQTSLESARTGWVLYYYHLVLTV
jgi:hypothetical protein